jgi:glycosyltransferase involved in cell wall biosynthesis
MLRTALASFTANTPSGVQILVVDSASTTDETRLVAEAAGVDYVRSDIKGLSIARNLGLQTSRRSILVYTDDDCVGVEGWLDPVLPHFADPSVGAVTGRMLDHTMIGEAAPKGVSRRFEKTLDGIDAGHGAIMAFRRELLVDLGGFDPVLGAGRELAGAEDLDIFCRILDDGQAIEFDPKCVIHHMNTREDEAYAQLHRGYGLGLGALTGKWVRLRPTVGISMLAIVTKRTLSRAVRNRRQPRRRRADMALFGGIVSGLFMSLRIKLDRRVFIDAQPPAPITLHASSGRNGDES